MAEQRPLEMDDRTPPDIAGESPLRESLARQMANASSDAMQLSAHPTGMVISVRASGSARARVAQALGVEALPFNNTVAGTGLGHCLWVRPDE